MIEPCEWDEVCGALQMMADDDERTCKPARWRDVVKRVRTTKTATKEDDHLPLHAKQVPTLDYASLSRLSPEVKEALSWNTNAARYEAITRETRRPHPVSSVSEADLALLEASGVIEKVSSVSLLKRVGSWFSVVEELKRRRRGIFWPKALNQEMREHADFDFVPVEDALRAQEDLQRFGSDVELVASCWDLTCSFYQCELHEDVRSYFGFVLADGTAYQMCRMPMGSVHAPGVMHTVTEALATKAAAGLNVVSRAYVDNIRFVGPLEEVKKANARLLQLAAEANVTFNEEVVNTPHTSGPFLGMEFDYSKRTVRIDPAKKAKYSEIARRVANPGYVMKDFVSDMGALYHTARLLRMPIAKLYVPIKMYRRRMSALESGELTLESPVDVWTCAKKPLGKWLRTVQSNRAVPVLHPETDRAAEYVLVTDASTKGWGAVLFDMTSGQVNTIGGSWKKAHTCNEINELEAAGVLLALKECPARIRKCAALDILVDNTSVKHTLAKGSAREFRLNEVVGRVLDKLGGNAKVRIGYIPTGLNVADSVSRGRALDEQLMSVLKASGRLKNTAWRQIAAPVQPTEEKDLLQVQRETRVRG